MATLTKNLYYLLISFRPRQWLKNLAVFAAIFFGGRLLVKEDLTLVIYLFIIFCLLSSSMYLINDIVDKEADKVHFSKKTRPLASGLLSQKVALFAALVLILLTLLLTFFISELIFATAVVFIGIQLIYSLFLKRTIIFDIMAISFSFMLRVFAGSFIISEPLSSWLILTVMMLSLFLAIGKRRSELTLLTHQQAVKHREILSHYPISFLDGLAFMMAGASLLTYSLFTFNTGRAESFNPFTTYLPITLINPRWLMVTIPIVAYGIFRYLYLIFERKEGESPEKILLKDLPLFSAVSLWVLTSFILIYVFNS